MKEAVKPSVGAGDIVRSDKWVYGKHKRGGSMNERQLRQQKRRMKVGAKEDPDLSRSAPFGEGTSVC